MTRSVALLLSGCLVLGAVACAKRSPEPAPAKAPAGGGAPAVTPPPSGSPLSAIHEGMRPEEVQKILGVPESIRPYITGKAFIPFYYGRDRTRTGYYYKGKGRVVFSGDGGFSTNSRVLRVEYDPNEPGYSR